MTKKTKDKNKGKQKENILSPDEENQQKEILWYQSTVDAWYETRMEVDKQILTLSALGIGLLMTLTKGFTNPHVVVLWCAAAVSFLVSIFLILQIFSKNSDYLVVLIQETDEKHHSNRLRFMTLWAHGLFFLGAVITVVLALKTIVFA